MTRVTLACEAGASAAAEGGLLCIVYRGEHDDSYPDKAATWINAAATAEGVPAIPVMVVIEVGAGTPEGESRRKYSESFTRAAPQMECFAHVIVATGLRGVAFRAIASTIHLVARHPTETRVFGTVEDAADWILSRSSVCSVAPDALVNFVDSVRRA